MHEILFIAKKYSLLSPDLILIFLQIRLKNPEVLRSMGPRTSIQIGKNSIEGRAPSYFLIFSSDALVAAKPLSLLGHPQSTLKFAQNGRINKIGCAKKYINFGKLRAPRMIVSASWTGRRETHITHDTRHNNTNNNPIMRNDIRMPNLHFRLLDRQQDPTTTTIATTTTTMPKSNCGRLTALFAVIMPTLGLLTLLLIIALLHKQLCCKHEIRADCTINRKQLQT
ncbi:hypothetical protein HELRODRAFT_158300 [Helobdella robusta]|uniref:Uncharacterized protein n=1 Tax=Helobdella robusta TaxID=6412 RepID=T1EML9_HELRO|nr:hypothetical protein HELRODRAFT_158300 [Helobdella robusta]ESO11938.1 hypothetical protein HELRODRAFT_158300 [Helobdella robusta]